MDFGGVGFDSSVVCSNSNNYVSFALDGSNNSSDGGHQLRKWFGSGHSKPGKRMSAPSMNEGGEEDVVFGEFKVAKTNPSSPFGEQMLKNPFLQRSNNVGEDCNQQMLSFSSQNPTTLPPYYHHLHHGASDLNGDNIQGIISSVRAPFTPSQWIELEHQAMIYKYIIDNIPVPLHLLNPIRKAFESAPFTCYSGFKSNPLLGWGSAHLGFSNSNDPEPGRCRRTDGKKWRCSRDAVGDQKYCERHMNRGRHRSRKPVEAGGHGSQPSNRKTTLSESQSSKGGGGGGGGLGISHQCVPLTPNTNRNLSDKDDSITKHHQNPYQEASNQGEFGLVCSDSLLNPLNPSSSFVAYDTSGSLDNHEEGDKSKHFLRQFIDDWPKNQLSHQLSDFMASSTSSPANDKQPPTPSTTAFHELDMGLSVGITKVPWEASMGGPLGEVLHANSIGECKNSKSVRSIDLVAQNWDHESNNNNGNGYLLASSSPSPTGVLQRPELYSVSNSSAGSSPRGESGKTLDGNKLCNNGSIFGGGTM